MQRREAGFTFIEILVVMGIIVVLMGMVAVIVPRAQEAAKQTESMNNVRNMAQALVDRSIRKRWPKFDGKNFTMALAAYKIVDARNEDNLAIFFSPGDENYFLQDGMQQRFLEITPQALQAGNDYHDLTSYAGRRNLDKDYMLTANKLKMIVPIFCDDDDGPIHHTDGLVMAYSDGKAKFVEWNELDIFEPEDPDNPEPFLGENASNEILRGLASD